MLTYLLFAIALMAPLARGDGGAVCDFTLTYAKIETNEDNLVSMPPRTFPVYVSFVSGWHDTCYERLDECGNNDDTGILSMTATFNGDNLVLGDTIDPGDVFYRHSFIGSPSNTLNTRNMLADYFDYFFWSSEGDNGAFYPIDDEGPDAIMGYWSAANVDCDGCDPDLVYALVSAKRTNCYDNPTPFSPLEGVTVNVFAEGDMEYGADNNPWEWTCFSGIKNTSVAYWEDYSPNDPVDVDLTSGSDVVYTDVRGHVHDYSSVCSPGMINGILQNDNSQSGCWYFKPSPNFNAPQLTSFWRYPQWLGQANRFRFTLYYQALPNNAGPVCLYYGYTGIQGQWGDSPNAETATPYQFWCGTLAPYGTGVNGVNTLTVEVPMSFPPAYWNIDDADFAQGPNQERAFIIRGNTHSSFVLFGFGQDMMAETNSCRRRRADGTVDPVWSSDTVDQVKAAWGAIPIPPPTNISSFFRTTAS